MQRTPRRSDRTRGVAPSGSDPNSTSAVNRSECDKRTPRSLLLDIQPVNELVIVDDGIQAGSDALHPAVSHALQSVASSHQAPESFSATNPVQRSECNNGTGPSLLLDNNQADVDASQSVVLTLNVRNHQSSGTPASIDVNAQLPDELAISAQLPDELAINAQRPDELASLANNQQVDSHGLLQLLREAQIEIEEGRKARNTLELELQRFHQQHEAARQAEINASHSQFNECMETTQPTHAYNGAIPNASVYVSMTAPVMAPVNIVTATNTRPSVHTSTTTIPLAVGLDTSIGTNASTVFASNCAYVNAQHSAVTTSSAFGAFVPTSLRASTSAASVCDPMTANCVFANTTSIPVASSAAYTTVAPLPTSIMQPSSFPAVSSTHVVVMQRDASGREFAQMVPVMQVADVPFMSSAAAEHHRSYADTREEHRPGCNNNIGATTMRPMLSNGSQISERRRLHDLPSFSGRPEEWPLFVNTFHATTEAYNYSDLENLLRLQKSLIGLAKDAVSSMLIHPQHVNQVMASLELKFGHPDILVRSQIEVAKQQPAIDDEHIDQLVSFATCVQNLATFLDTAATQHHLSNPTLLDELVGKLPISRRIDWAGAAIRIVPHPTIKDFAKWITEIARLVSMVVPTATIKSKGKTVLLSVLSDTENSPSPICAFCSGMHESVRCVKFNRLSIVDRWQEVKARGLCFACLGSDHILPGCQQKRKCGVSGCEKWHNTRLHDSTRDSMATKASGSNGNRSGRSGVRRNNSHAATTNADVPETTQIAKTPAAVNIVRERQEGGQLLFRVVPVVLHGRGRSVETYALLDEGSSLTLLDADVADELQLDGPMSELNVSWFNANTTVEGSRKVSLNISGQHNGVGSYELTNVRTIRNLKLPIQSVNMNVLRESCPHLRSVPIRDYHDVQPKILIGLDHHHLGVPLDVRMGDKQRGMIAAQTVLGWVIYGCDDHASCSRPVVMHVGHVNSQDEQLHELVRAFISTEDLGVKVFTHAIESDEIKRARRIMDETTRRVGNRYETGLLWRTDDVVLPNNYHMAMQRLRSVESKMRRNHQYAERYNQQIADYLAKGYARRMTDAEQNTHDDRSWYLPHFAVTNPNKPDKFRLVFDAAATFDGVSLNAKLLVGPDVNVPLMRLLMQFRMGMIGVCADVREMYHQVRVRDADQNAQRFLWRGGDSSSDPEVYVMTVMTFGSACSPASAQHVKNVNAAEYEHEFPSAAAAIRTKHYVDDFVACFDSPETAAKVTADVVEVHRRGGFELRGFVSNSSAVLAQLGSDTGSGDSVCKQMEFNATEKVLGMFWETGDDVFTYLTRFSRVRPDVMTGDRCPTKREILSVSMSVFDPFGFLAAFMLESKIILQDLWRNGVDWDASIPESIERRWHDWRSEIEHTRKLEIPRCYTKHIRTSTDTQLHIFADASKTAFAACAYWRVAHTGGIDLSFIIGRTRCATIKILTVPRLELEAAFLATRLLEEIRRSHVDVSITKVVLWSDSQTVIKWLRSDQRKYKQFVAFRVAEILEVAPVTSWRWLPTAMNPADDATRVQRPPKFDLKGRWIWGPDWLRETEDDWPAQMTTDVAASECNELRRKFVGSVSIVKDRNIVDFERFSRFNRLCRTIAWVHRFAMNVRKVLAQRVRSELTAAEIDDAMLYLCWLVQREAYWSEYEMLRNKQELSVTSQIYVLKPYIDDDGLMRIYGRTDAAADEYLPLDARRPILLPRKHRFTMLLVRHHHEQMAHQLVNATIASIRRRFWVPQLRVLVQSVQNECNACKKRSARPMAPIQGQLPKDRLTPYQRPFTNTGLDYFGPVAVTVGRRREKRWVALFTCLAVRAVHLEIAADLSTDSCLVCVKNLCNLRGTPSCIRCDNGTNFVGAAKELKNADGFIDSDTMQRELSTKGIEWKFNCPGNPEAGGVWERLIQSVKRILLVNLKEDAPRVETLRAHLLETANMLNARPLTHLPVPPDEMQPLTPNHFLIGGPNAVTMACPTIAEPSYTKKQWRICRELSRRFWVRWVAEYLPELTRRSKNYPERPELKDGDLVVVCDSSLPRGSWPMGKISTVAIGTDGRVRTAEVRTSQGTYRRPVTKLALLDV